MKRGKIVLIVLALIMVLGMIPAQAEVPHKGDWAFGTHLSLPAIGSSVKYWITDKWGGQLTVIPTSILTGYAAKAIFKLKEGKNHYLYGGLSLGRLAIQYSSTGYQQHDYKGEISGLSLTGGVEWIIKRWLVLSFEIGYGWFDTNISTNGDPVDLGEYKTINSPIIGIGFHSYFFK